MAAPSSVFRDLHSNPKEILVLPNAWDAGSARLVESLGAKAVATTSAGVAWSLGYPDVNKLPLDLHIHAVRRIVATVRIPVSIDFEGGYSENPVTVARHLTPFIEGGIAGINIEDGRGAPGVLASKVEAIKGVAARMGVDLFVNVRSDVWFQKLVPPGEALTEALARSVTYRDAGADCMFFPGLQTEAEIRRLAAGTGLPVALLAWPGLAPADRLVTWGVRRLTAGSGIYRAAMERTAELADGFIKNGDSGPVSRDAFPYDDMQRLFERG